MTASPAEHLDQLKSGAWRRLGASRQAKTRIAVQVGHCSTAVGAELVAQAIAESLPEASYAVVTGCDGACFNAPQVLLSDPVKGLTRYSRVTPDRASLIARGFEPPDTESAPFFHHQHRVALDLCGLLDPSDVEDYIMHGGYAGLARALAMTPEEVIAEVEVSGLRGRGGAYFPAALKWRGARRAGDGPRYLVVNSEEGEPGVFKDRHLMEGVPHRILEGAIIAAYASGTEQAFIYINAEADLSAQRMELTVSQAEANGLLGDDILGSGFSLQAEIRRGAGGYVCGEETTLLNTVEGYRREPRIRPPFPTDSGLWSRPTVINNPETLSSVPFILSHGAAAFSQIGDEKATGTKLVSLSGAIRRPGVAEVPLGTTLHQIIMEIGGGPPSGSRLSALAVGGPSSGILPPGMLDLPILPGLIHPSGVMLGAGGIVALDQTTPVLDAVRALASYNAAESCGKCTPCREGTPRIVAALDRLSSAADPAAEIEELRFLAHIVNQASLCGLGQAAGNPITSALELFPEEFTPTGEGRP